MSLGVVRTAVLGVIAGTVPFLATYDRVCPIIFA